MSRAPRTTTKRSRTTDRRASNPPVSLQGFDEYMNIVLDAAEEVNKKKGTRKSVGRILLKGDNITMMVSVSN